MLPIHFCQPGDLGYPPAVVKYFSTLSKVNDLGFTAHGTITCFIVAAHMAMLEWLKIMQAENNFDGPWLHKHWHEVMEPHGTWDAWNLFFLKWSARLFLQVNSFLLCSHVLSV